MRRCPCFPPADPRCPYGWQYSLLRPFSFLGRLSGAHRNPTCPGELGNRSVLNAGLIPNQDAGSGQSREAHRQPPAWKAREPGHRPGSRLEFSLNYGVVRLTAAYQPDQLKLHDGPPQNAAVLWRQSITR